jgi:hypothetical protein
MNSSPTRRSFIKGSVVAAVAVSSLTIFSGLVDAQESGSSGIVPGCSKTNDGPLYVRVVNGKEEPYGYHCTYKGRNCSDGWECGTVDVGNGQEPIYVICNAAGNGGYCDFLKL